MTILLALLVSFPLYAANTSTQQLVRAIDSCFSAKGLQHRVADERQLRHKLKGPDLRLRLITGYSNNEISSNNPERVQAGANIRWEDITDESSRNDLLDVTSESTLQENKLLLEEYWRSKLVDFYYWKWGRSSKINAEKFNEYTQNKLSAGADSFRNLATTKTYSDLIELNRLSAEFLAKMEVLDKTFTKCPDLVSWNEKLDFDRVAIENYSNKNSNRILYANKYCAAKKRIKTIGMKKEAGHWAFALNSSITRNRQVAGGSNQFNDLRFGLELNIPLNTAKVQEVTVDSCDYQTRTIQEEDFVERKMAKSLYPVLQNFQLQYELMKDRTSKMEVKSAGLQTQDVTQLGLNYFKLHTSLSNGEAKMNSRIIPSQIVENEF